MLGSGGWWGRPHVPPGLDNSSSYNHKSLAIMDLSWVVLALSWSVWALTCSRTIVWTTEDWEFGLDYEEQTVDTYPQPQCLRYRKPDFYQVHWMIQLLTTNLNHVLDGSNDRLYISPTIGCYVFPKKKKTVNKF